MHHADKNKIKPDFSTTMLRKLLFSIVKNGQFPVNRQVPSDRATKESRAVLRGFVDSVISVIARHRIQHCPFGFDRTG